MDFANDTPYHAAFMNTVMGADHMLGAVIARPTFRIEGSRLAHDPADPWPIEAGTLDTRYGSFMGDVAFLTGGVDVFVIGNAYYPDGRSGPHVQVDVRVGTSFHRSIAVFGDRVWAGGLADSPAWPRRSRVTPLVATDPEPFRSMPLSYERAYGGTAQTEHGELPWPANPRGRGYYLTLDQAAGQPLPNLEDPLQPITSYRDQPEVIGTAPYPADGALRSLNALVLEEHPNPQDTRLKQIKPLVFNSAHPKMIIPPHDAPTPGDLVHVTNVRPEGDIQFALPDLPLHARVTLEDRRYHFPLHLDQIGILAEEARVFLSYRVVFKYRVEPLERRQTTLAEGGAPTIPSGHSTAPPTIKGLS